MATRQFPGGQDIGDYTAPSGGPEPESPVRLALYMQNWTGITTWETWQNDSYDPRVRGLIAPTDQRDATNILARNPAHPYSPAPIAISQYALNTQQVYNG